MGDENRCECPARKALTQLLAYHDGYLVSEIDITAAARAALSVPCPCEGLREQLAEHEAEHWCFNDEHRAALIERDDLRAEVEQLKAGNVKAAALDKFADVVRARNEDVETIRQLRAELDETVRALEELVRLQAHYAKLLNMHDGGQRHPFTTAHEWIERLRELEKLRAVPAQADTGANSDPARCLVCGWPLAASVAEGCVVGNCSQRPRDGKRKKPQ